MFQSFLEYAGGTSGHSVTRTNFRNKIIAYCKFKEFDFNIDKPIDNKAQLKQYYSDWKPNHPDETFVGDSDKSGGTEFFTVFSKKVHDEKNLLINFSENNG